MYGLWLQLDLRCWRHRWRRLLGARKRTGRLERGARWRRLLGRLLSLGRRGWRGRAREQAPHRLGRGRLATLLESGFRPGVLAGKVALIEFLLGRKSHHRLGAASNPRRVGLNPGWAFR